MIPRIGVATLLPARASPDGPAPWSLGSPRVLRQCPGHGERRPAPTADCSVHRAVSPFRIRGFTCEPERALDGPRKTPRRLGTTDQRVAIRTAREGIVLPVVRPARLDLGSDAPARDTKIRCESRQGALLFFGRGSSRQSLPC